MKPRVVVACGLALFFAGAGYLAGRVRRDDGDRSAGMNKLREEKAAVEARLAESEAALQSERQTNERLKQLRDALTARTTGRSSASQETAQLPVVDIAPDASLFAEFSENEVAFLQKYDGKRLRISSAYVGGVKAPERYEDYAALVSVNRLACEVGWYGDVVLECLECVVRKDQCEEVARLKDGDLVTVDGVVEKYGGNVRLADAHITAVNRQLRQTELPGWEAWPLVEFDAKEWEAVGQLLKKDERLFWEQHRGRRFKLRIGECETNRFVLWGGGITVGVEPHDGTELPEQKWRSAVVVGVPVAGGPGRATKIRLVHCTFEGTAME